MKFFVVCLLAIAAAPVMAMTPAPSAVSATPARTAATAAAPVNLGPIVVSATKAPQPVLDTAATINVITAREIQDILATNIKQMVRYLPGISVPDDPTRFGLQGFNIRGIGGNRVLTLLDGVRVPDSFSIGSFSDAGRDFVDPDVLKRVEIIRGPASSLYGSDAVGGVVSFFTKDPGDFLARTGSDFYAGLGTGYSTADDGAMGTGTLAFGNADNQGMIVFTRRQGHQFENMGDVDTQDASRTTPNPQNYQDNSMLAKGVFHPGGAKLSVELYTHHADTDTTDYSALTTTDYTGIVGFPYILQNTSLTGHDTNDLDRLSATLEFGGSSWFDTGTAIAYYQYGDTQQDSVQGQTVTIYDQPTDYLIHRYFTFDQHIAGASLTFQKHLRGDVSHLFVYGADARRTHTEEMRNGEQENLATGDTTTDVPPDNFPVRDFPLSTTWDAGAFFEDRIGFVGDRFLIVPGLRYDYYRLDADNDAIFAKANPDVTPQDESDSSVSPRLGLVYKLDEQTSLFGQYAYGYRAPPYDDVNVGFTNLEFGYTAIPNPDLKSETSNSFELGLRHYGAAGSFTVDLYYDRFRNFIEPFVPLGVDPKTRLLTYQAQNIGKVTIYGVEFQGTLGLDFLTPGLRLDGALAWGVGNDNTADQPLNSVSPPEAVLGLGYLAPNGRWNLRLVGTFVRAKTRVNEDPANGTQFKTPGYATLDLIGNVHLADNLKLTVGLFNITDRKYWNWGSVQGRPEDDPVIDRYTQPGFNVGASLRMYW